MTEQESTPQGKHGSTERDSSSSKTKHCQGKTFISFMGRKKNQSEFPQCFFYARKEAKVGEEAWVGKGGAVIACFYSEACLSDVLIFLCVWPHFSVCAFRYADIQTWQIVIRRGQSCESHGGNQVLEILQSLRCCYKAEIGLGGIAECSFVILHNQISTSSG